MLSTTDLLTCDSYVQLREISLELYCKFSQQYLLPRRFHYYFEDGTDAVIEFQEYGIRHMLGIHHINGNIGKKHLFEEIENGLSLRCFEQSPAMKQRFKNQKPRIRLFSCVYNTMRCGRVFYCPNQQVANTVNVKMDYIIYREIDDKGLNIGVRKESGCFVPLTILVAKKIRKNKYIDGSHLKIVKRLEISDISNNSVIENIVYSNSFIASGGVQ